MGHLVTSKDIPLDGERLPPGKFALLKTVCLIVGGAGGLASVLFLFLGPEAARASYAYSWLWAFFFFLTIALGGCFWTLLHNLSNSGWGTSVRRVMENVGFAFPFLLLFGLPFLCPQVRKYLWEWMGIQSRNGCGLDILDFFGGKTREDRKSTRLNSSH